MKKRLINVKVIIEEVDKKAEELVEEIDVSESLD